MADKAGKIPARYLQILRVEARIIKMEVENDQGSSSLKMSNIRLVFS